MRRVEAVLWEHAADAFLAQHPEAEACNSAHAFTTNSGYFERLQRTVNACERNYHRALKELQRLQVARAHGLRALNPQPSPRNPNNPKPVPRNWLRSGQTGNPAYGSPKTTGLDAACRPLADPRLGEPRENLVKTLRSLPRPRWKQLKPPPKRFSINNRPICDRRNLR